MVERRDKGLLLVGLARSWAPIRGNPISPEAGDYDDGIVALSRNPATGALGEIRAVTPLPSTSFLAPHPNGKWLYSVSEFADDTECRITGFAISDFGELEQLNDQPTAGVGACHAAVHPHGQHVMTAHFGSGNITVHPLDSDGRLTPHSQVLQHKGSGPHPRQKAPHAHMIEPSPDERWAMGVDLGTDEIITYSLDLSAGQLLQRQHPAAKVQPGAGPRHLVFHSAGYAFVANELDSSVAVLSYHSGTGALAYRSHLSTLIEGGSEAENRCGAVRLSPDERFLYVGNRGRDTIAVFSVDRETLTPIQEAPAGGRWARDMIVADNVIYTANNRSSSVTIQERDADTGLVGRILQTVHLPVPTCLLRI